MADSAQAVASSPRRWARDRACALRSSLTLASSVSPRSSPWAPTGLAAPMVVPGAMAATCAAQVISVPAEAA
jgi:hypothetical protein